MRPATSQRGAAAERFAEAHLKAHGLATLARNYRCPGGELDLVMRDGVTLVFVEVRMRTTRGFGGAEASVDARKRARIARCAAHYLQKGHGPREAPCRFDVVALYPAGEQYDVNWIRAAFTL
ncbi:MAG: YraN family protein [Gammaproteobacteria bacterium]|nr:YraN family protein [Gammaproteobacteria bacterium]